MHENPLIALAALYGLDVVAQTLKSINAFEITYNGQLLHSKLKSGRFPNPSDLVARLETVKREELAQAKPAQHPEATGAVEG